MEVQYRCLTAEGLDNLPQAAEIRQEVFVEEQGFHNEFDEIDAAAWHTVIYDNGRPAATGRAFLEDGAWHIGRVAVRKEFRGKQYGAAVMQALERKIAELGAESVGLSAQVQARGFYEKLGYEAHGGEYLDEHCPHVSMTKCLK